MSAKVVDASALAALLFGEPDAEVIAARLEKARLFAPTLLPFEIASVCLKKIKRHPSTREGFVRALALIDRMAIEYVDVMQTEVVDLAERKDLTAYDASYLWLATRLGAELVTLDKRLGATRGS